MPMPATVVVGTQWGDEGKGKVVDYLARDADMIVRSQGGNNAGHTVKIKDETFRLYHIPCGILHPSKTSVIASGVAINPPKLWEEIQGLQARGCPCDRLIISHHAHLIMPYHILLDSLEEERRASRDSRGKIGTTRRGIGPVFADKMYRSGFRLCDLANPSDFRERLRLVCEEKNTIIKHLYRAEPLDPDQIADKYLEVGEKLKPYIGDAVKAIMTALSEGKHVIFEGAQGTLLDIDYGFTYPFLTSSHPVSAGACLGTGLPPNKIDRIVGVVKAYVSRVGEGPFPTELSGDLASKIRDRGTEYGTTTGRPRRVGWLDLVLLNYSARLNGLTEIAITKVDVLDDLPQINVAVAYELDGETFSYPPSDPILFSKVKPVLKTFPGWLSDTSSIDKPELFPPQLRAFLDFVSQSIGVPVTLVGVGKDRCQMVEYR